MKPANFFQKVKLKRSGRKRVSPAHNLWAQHFDATAFNSEFVRIYGDVNGDNLAGLAIVVQNVQTLQATDFTL